MQNTFVDDDYSNFDWRNLFPITKAKDVVIQTTPIYVANNGNSKSKGLFTNIKNNIKEKQGSGRFLRIPKQVLEAYRQKKKREQEILATLQVIKNQEAYNSLQRELANLQSELAKLKLSTQKQIPLPPQVTETIIAKIDENPSVEVSKQLESIPEIPQDEIEEVKKDEKVVEEIKKENGASDKKGGIPKWLLPTLVIGGIAYFVFRKK